MISQNKKVLLIDNRMDPPIGSPELRRYLNRFPVYARRGPERDLPANIGEYSHIVISGSRASCLTKAPWVDELLAFIRTASELSIPMLGVCLGHQMIARAFGGIESVRKSNTPEFGWVKIRNSAAGSEDDWVMGSLDREFFSYASHYEEVATLPRDFITTASNERCAIQAFRHESKPIFGIQFHPERNAEDGQIALNAIKKKAPKDSIFNDGKSEQCFRKETAERLFSRFLEIER